MGLRNLTFIGGSFKNKKKLALVQIMNSVSMNNKIIANNVGVFNDSVAMNSIFSE